MQNTKRHCWVNPTVFKLSSRMDSDWRMLFLFTRPPEKSEIVKDLHLWRSLVECEAAASARKRGLLTLASHVAWENVGI